MLDKIIDKAFSSSSDFPTEIFPKQIQDLIKDAENSVGYNPDFLSAGILSVCAAALGNSITLFNGSYSSQPILWLAIVGRQGIGKTHPLNFAKIPMEKKDKKSYAEYKKCLNDYESQKEKGRKPVLKKYLLTDFTPEKLAEILQYNKKGVLIYKDELMGWINSFDRYNNSGDQQQYLEFFNGGILTVDRVSKDPIRVEKTNVNILGGIQPKKLKALASNGRNDDGFLSRILFVYPKNLKPNKFTGLSIGKRHVENYQRLILNLNDAEPKALKITEKQIKIYKEWQHEKIEESFNDDVEISIQAKLETYLWRLALIIEMMDQASTNQFTDVISDNSITRAIVLIEYFRNNALKVYDKMISANPLEDLPLNKVDLYKKLPPKFKRKEVLKLFDEHKVRGGSVNRFLKNKSLFDKRDNNGNYEKKIS